MSGHGMVCGRAQEHGPSFPAYPGGDGLPMSLCTIAVLPEVDLSRALQAADGIVTGRTADTQSGNWVSGV